MEADARVGAGDDVDFASLVGEVFLGQCRLREEEGLVPEGTEVVEHFVDW